LRNIDCHNITTSGWFILAQSRLVIQHSVCSELCQPANWLGERYSSGVRDYYALRLVGTYAWAG
jgi:hypothetical protein